MTKTISILTFLVLVMGAFFWLKSNATTSASTEDPVVVLAASSLTNVLQDVAKAWKKAEGGNAVFSFDSTSRLAQQIKAGAPADLFFSADIEWMDDVEGAGNIQQNSRIRLLSNRMAVVVPTKSTFVPKSVAELVDPRLEHFALAGEWVPAGKFARAALRSEKVFSKIQDRIVVADNVRGALQWVAKGEVEAGVVFRTDALVEPRVRISFLLPESSHSKIEYPAALLQGLPHPIRARAFLDFCRSKPAARIFEAAGFTVLEN